MYAIIILSFISGFSIAAPMINNKYNQRPFGMPAYIQDKPMAPRFGGPVPYHVYGSYYQPLPTTRYYWSPVIYPATKTRTIKFINNHRIIARGTTRIPKMDFAAISSETARATLDTSTEVVTDLPQITTTLATATTLATTTTSQSLTNSHGQTGTHSSGLNMPYNENMEPL